MRSGTVVEFGVMEPSTVVEPV